MKCKTSFPHLPSKIKVLLPLIFLYFICFLQIVLCDKNSPSLLNSNKNLLSTKNDLLFVSTRDGFFHAFVPSTNSFLLKWTTSLGPELISSNITTTKITDDLLLLPLDDKLYIYENGQLTSLDIFVKDLVEKTPQSFNDFLLIGNKKSTVFVIDKSTGKIIQHSDIDNNLVNSYTNVTKANTITVIRIDYILTCLGKEEKFWNAMYSDIIIQKGSQESNIGYLPHKNDIFMVLLNSSEISEKDIVTVHSYDNEYNLPVKIYDKNKREGKTGEIMKRNKYLNLKEYIKEAQEQEEKDAKIRSQIVFTIWEAPEKKVSELASNTEYQKIECKYQEKPDADEGIKVSFLLGFKDNTWQLWAGKPGVVSYSDDSYVSLDEVEFYKAVNAAVDKCVELINQIKDEPNNWVQYYATTTPQ